jgi:hypothetical protein
LLALLALGEVRPGFGPGVLCVFVVRAKVFLEKMLVWLDG